MEQGFTEFSKFRDSDKSLKHELGSILRSCVSRVSCWCCGSILLSYTRGGWVAGLSPFAVMTNNSMDSVNSMKSVYHLQRQSVSKDVRIDGVHSVKQWRIQDFPE